MGRRRSLKPAFRELSGLAMHIADPTRCNLVRVPTTDYARTSTALLDDQVTIASTNSSPPGFSQTCLNAIFYGQPARSMLCWQTLQDPDSTFTYNCYFAGPGASTYWTIKYNNGDDYPYEPSSGWWPLVAATSEDTSSPHGQVLPIGLSANIPFVFMNAGDKFTGANPTDYPFGSGDLTANLWFNVYRWCGRYTQPCLVQTGNINFSDGEGFSYLFVAPTAGYYALNYAGASIVSGTSVTATWYIVVNLETYANVGWRFYHHVDADVFAGGDPNMLLNVRATASTLLFTNATSALNAQGSVVAARIRSVDGLDVTQSILAKAAEKYEGNASKGIYTFKEFSAYAEVFRTCVLQSGEVDAALNPAYDLDFDDYYHYITMQVPSATINTFNVRYCTAIEFRLDSARYERSTSEQQYEALIAARKLISSNPEWFYENPLHMAQIYNFIRSYAGSAWRAIKTATPYATALMGVANPSLNPALLALNRAVQGL